MTDACEAEEGVRGREKVNSGHWQKRPEDAGGNPDASTDIHPGVGSGRDGKHGQYHPGRHLSDASGPVVLEAVLDGRKGGVI